MRKKAYIFLIGILGVFSPSAVTAQEIPLIIQEVNQDSLGNVTDEFQEHFFEALKQKGIENYEKAITSLKKCEGIQPDNPVVHFELGKNYRLLGDYDAAVNSFQKANRLQPNQEWYMVELMESYYAKRDFDQAIIVAKKLVPLDVKFNNNLADLYFRSQRYDDLLALLDKLDAAYGMNEFRLGLRQQIYAINNDTPAQIQVIKDAIAANPEDESNYLNLILVYSEAGMEEEAFNTAKEMKENFPASTVVHLALYKFYIDSKDISSAVNSMKTVLVAEEIDAVSKLKVLNDFLIFVNENPSYEEELMKVVNIFAKTEESPGVYQKLGEYYLLKERKEDALTFFEQGIEKDVDNFQLLRNTLLLQLDLGKFSKAAELSETALEIFPAQPVFYLTRGVALNKSGSYPEAIEILTFGLDFLLEDPQMMSDFFEQLIIAYKETGNAAKAEEFEEKLEKLKNIN